MAHLIRPAKTASKEERSGGARTELMRNKPIDVIPKHEAMVRVRVDGR